MGNTNLSFPGWLPNEINHDWQFTQLSNPGPDEPITKADEWLPASKFPTNVHSELIKLKKIPDPFVGLHDHDVQWIGESDWAFKTQFTVPASALEEPNVDLVFEGLDTYANVTLNGHPILSAVNAFVEYRVPVKQYLKAGENDLQIVFPSSFFKGLELEEKNGKKAAWNGNSSRLHIRKPQYHYGWDWDPTIMTVGPWKPIYLQPYAARISDLHVKSTVSESLDVALDISLAAVSSIPASELTASLTIEKPDGTALLVQDIPLIQSSDTGAITGSLPLTFKKDEVEIWWPVGYGSQPLYTFSVILNRTGADDKDKAVAIKNQRLGFRRVKVVQEPLEGQEGLSFLFEVNNVRIFVGGSNWIPADSFLTEIPDKRYVDWLKLLVEGNQNMVRVWGGGIYEPDIFYDTCDELGILVWQDFMFACGVYPAYDDFVELVKPEVEQAVVRLRHHPSLAIYAGNNEDYMLAEIMKLPVDWSDLTSDPRKSALPARYIYETVLPEIVDRLGSGDVYYHRSSPYSIPGKSTMDLKYGDLHNWNVWHGEQLGWQKWEYMASRFVSEFGMVGFPDRRTVDAWVGENKAERHPQSRTSFNHNKATGHEKRLAQYLTENFRYSSDLEGYIYATQILQSEAVASAYRVWRRNWKGKGKEYTAGALVWQLNDCWPVTSWALVDYYLRPKPVFFTIQRELRPITVGVARYEKKGPSATNPKSSATVKIEHFIQVWGTNSTLNPVQVSLVLEAFDLHDRSFQWKETKDVTLAPNSSTDVHVGLLPGVPTLTKLSEVPRTIVVSAKLLDKDGAVISRNSNWPEPYKYINFPSKDQVGLKLVTSAPDSAVAAAYSKNYSVSNKKIDTTGATQITLSSQIPVKGIILDAEGDADVRWSDQALDLVPGDDQVVYAWGLAGRTPVVRYLGDGTV